MERQRNTSQVDPIVSWLLGKLNTEEASKTASDYKVMSIPTIILFKDGEAKETLVGLQSKETLIAVINKYL